MMIESSTPVHPDDEVLVRYLDDELSAAQRVVVGDHADACGACAARIAALERRSEALGRLLREVDAAWAAREVHAPRRPRTLVKWRRVLAAAAVPLVVTAVGVASPLRAWIVERSHALWELVVGAPQSDAAESTARPARPRPLASVSFVADAPALVIEVDRHQATGTLTVIAVETHMVSATLGGGTGPGDLVVLPGRLQIANAAASTASYQVAVPSRLERVEVRIAGTVVGTVRPTELGERWETRLAAPAPQGQNSR